MIWNNKFQLKSKLKYRLNMEKIQIKNKYFSPSIFRFGTKIKWLKSTTYPCTIYKCYKCSGFLTKELRVASYVLRVTSYYLLHEVRVTFSCMSHEFFFAYCRSYELLFIAWVTSSFYKRVVIYCTSYELIFTCKLQVTIYSTSYELILKVNFYVWITSYYLWHELRVCF